MSKIDPDKVTNCMRCTELLDRGYSGRWQNNKCVEVICFKCDKKEALEDHMKTGVITTHFMMDCMMDVYNLFREQYPDRYGSRDTHDEAKLIEMLRLPLSKERETKLLVQIATARICNKVKEFEARVWFKGLQQQILDTSERGVSARLGKEHKNLCVLTWSGMARTMITIEDDDASVTCVTEEKSTESRMGFHGINATGAQALALYDKAIALYESGVLKFEIDKKVSLF